MVFARYTIWPSGRLVINGVRLFGWFILMGSMAARIAWAQRDDGSSPTPVATAMQVHQLIRLDGRLDENAWRAAQPQ